MDFHEEVATHAVRRTHVTRSVLDLNDQVVEVWDARELEEATWKFGYDLAGRRVATEHTTALGTRFALSDAADNPIWSRDARGIEVNRTFDALHRPLSEHSDDGVGVKLRRAWRYIDYDEQDPDFPSHQAANLFGQVEEARDADGLRFFEYDHRGLVTKVSHRFWDRDWTNGSSAFWQDGGSWDPAILADARSAIPTWLALQHLTDPTTLEITTAHDAAGRPVQVDYPQGMRVRSTYNAAGLLQTVEADRGTGTGWKAVLSRCAYNARGQLVHQDFGNGTSTQREYDPDIERLVRIFTEHSGQGLGLQDLRYTYDPVGNPLEIEDALTNPTYSANQPIPNTRGFHYDARYRLVRARGRKLKSVGMKDINPYAPAPGEQDYEAYDYRYRYDEVGNFTKNHEYSRGQLHYKDGRLDLFNGDGKEAIDGAAEAGNWTYDANGNATHTPRHQELAYTQDNQIRYADMGGDTEVRYFRHGDQRVLKFVRKNGVKALGVYLGPWEYHERTGVNARAKVVLHVGGHGRHAQAEVVLDGADSEPLPWFFVHADHLGSGHIITKADGSLLSQEEYFPYGRASDRRDTRNRYRFIGVEQDEDIGLCMTGPRTYDVVSGRFLQGDPIASERGGINPFHYASGNPVGRNDPGGYSDEILPDSAQPNVLAPGQQRTIWEGGGEATSRTFAIPAEGSDTPWTLEVSTSPGSYTLEGTDPQMWDHAFPAVTGNLPLDVNIDTGARTITITGQSDIVTSVLAGVDLSSATAENYGTGLTLASHEFDHALERAVLSDPAKIGELLTEGWTATSMRSGEVASVGGPLVVPSGLSGATTSEQVDQYAGRLQGFVLASQQYIDAVKHHKLGPVPERPQLPW